MYNISLDNSKNFNDLPVTNDGLQVLSNNQMIINPLDNLEIREKRKMTCSIKSEDKNDIISEFSHYDDKNTMMVKRKVSKSKFSDNSIYFIDQRN